MHRPPYLPLLLAAALMLGLVPASGKRVYAAEQRLAACAGGHGQVYLTGFVGPPFQPGFIDRVPTSFYMGVEGGSGIARVAPTPGCGHNADEIGRVVGHFTTESDTASPVDYTHMQGETEVICQDIDDDSSTPAGCRSPVPNSHPVSVPLAEDEEAELLEWLTFQLTGGTANLQQGGNGVGGVAVPSQARMYIVDTDGAPSASLEPGADAAVYPTVKHQLTRINIPVFRAGPNASGTVGFQVTGEGDNPATPGVEFTCTPVCPDGGNGTLSVGSSRLGFIRINVNPNAPPMGDKDLRITLTEEGGDHAPDGTLFTTVRIRDISGDTTAPVSRFHHPRHKKRYRKSGSGLYPLLEMHTFFQEDPSGVLGAQIAFQRKMKNGNCKWWAGNRYRRGKCGAKRWLPMKFGEVGQLKYFFYHTPTKAWKVSTGSSTKIRSYRAWTRTRDFAGNIETRFQKGRNMSVFQIRP